MKIIGHAGAAGLAHANTAASFRAASAAGVDAIEFDVRVTQDDVVVVQHDPNIRGVPIAASSYADLLSLDADLLTLQQALALVQDIDLFVEIKPNVRLAPIITELSTVDRARISILSFDSRILARCADMLPDIPRYALEKWSTWHLRRKLRLGRTRRAIMRHTSLWSMYIRLLTRSGIELYTYTLDDPKKAARFARSGLTGVITDFPDRFKR